jgi:phosphate transport system substrate-binding protein
MTPVMKNLLSLVLCSCLVVPLGTHAQQKRIELQGSDTLILLGQRINQLYQRRQPLVTVSVHGGGVQSALPRLAKGEIDIAQAHGGLKLENAKELLAVPVGAEGIVLYVHESNPVNELSVLQVRAIYAGEILNWKQVGGPNQRIVLYGGDSPGMGAYFTESVMHGAEFFGYEGKTTTKDLLDVIGVHPNGLGFAGVGFAPHVKALKIRPDVNTPAVEPTITRIRSLEYPISRYIYWYLAGKPQGAVKDFCEWVFSPEGQLVVEGAGFQPLEPKARAAALRKLGFPSSIALW